MSKEQQMNGLVHQNMKILCIPWTKQATLITPSRLHDTKFYGLGDKCLFP